MYKFIGILLLLGAELLNAEVYTAISDMEHLLDTHKRIIDDLDHYIHKEEIRLDFLKTKVALYKEEHEKAMEDIPNYLGNPINAFTLIKRLTLDLDNIERVINTGTDYMKNVTAVHKDAAYPSVEDMTGTVEALIRLQDTYNLNVKELSDGKLNGVQYSNPLSASDTFEIGRTLYNNGDYHHSHMWMVQALRKYEEEMDDEYVSKADMLEYLAFTNYLQDNIVEALHWTEELVTLAPRHPRAVGNIPHYKKAIEEKKAQEDKKLRGEVVEEEKKEPQGMKPQTPERSKYEALCRGENDIPAEITKKLSCRYFTDNHPFLKIAPLKREQMYINPNIYVYYDIMTDNEIEFIKTSAKPRFQRATVHNPETGELVPANYRISKSAWLTDMESSVVASVSQRVIDMTGLSMDSAEQLQVVNYGIGGHYEPHFDFARREEKHAFKTLEGNRIATVLFYMSDVAQGGATVFTELGLTVFPVKGTAVFWMNLHPSGEGDFATRHAACPVLRGSKWVSNKWMHQGGQEFLKPCTLQYQDEGIIGQPGREYEPWALPDPPAHFQTNGYTKLDKSY